MTVTASTNRASFAGDGTTTPWVITFPITVSSDLKVMRRNADLTETLLALGADYTVSGPPYSAGATITPLTATTVGATYFVIGNVPNTQSVVLQDGGPLPAGTVNGMIDRIAMITRRLVEMAARSPLLRDTDTMGSGQMDVGTNRLINVTAGVNPTDGANVQQLTTAVTGPAGPAAWLPPVAWITGLVCVVGPPATTVTYLGETYVCTTAHTAGASFNAANFVKVAQKGAAGAGTGDMLAANNLSDVASAATSRINLGLAIGTNVQAWDTDLNALAAEATTGVRVRTGAGTTALRTLTADTGSKAGVAITNGDGVSGNPTIGVDISGQTNDASPDLTADYVMTFDASAGVNKKALLNTLGGSVFTKSYTSSDQTITAAGLLTIAHSLAAVPKFTRYLLVCVTAESGYSIGDLVEVSPGTNSSSVTDNYGFGAWLDSTNINIRFGSVATNTIIIVHKTTGALANATNSKWTLRISAYA